MTEKLEGLSASQVRELKEAFVKNSHPRLRKGFAVSKNQPYGKTSQYIKCIMNADLPKIVRLIKLIGMLSQSKVYLFYENKVAN